jgi:hypothetical protein
MEVGELHCFGWWVSALEILDCAAWKSGCDGGYMIILNMECGLGIVAEQGDSWRSRAIWGDLVKPSYWLSKCLHRLCLNIGCVCKERE